MFKPHRVEVRPFACGGAVALALLLPRAASSSPAKREAPALT